MRQPLLEPRAHPTGHRTGHPEEGLMNNNNLAASNGTPRLLNAKQVAERLNVSKAWVFQHANGARKPLLPSVKMGGAVRFREADIDTFIERCRRAMEKGVPIQ
jgi:excisionase family DNA binding protein